MPISEEVWDSEWSVLEDRWKKQSEEMQARYYEILSAIFEDAEFVEACAAVFVSREFFPRPQDFMTVRAGADFRAVMEALPHISQHMDLERYEIVMAGVSPMGREVLKAMGGSKTLANSKSGWIRLREHWDQCYGETIQLQVAQLPVVKERSQIETYRDQAGFQPITTDELAENIKRVGRLLRGDPPEALQEPEAPEGR